MWVEICTTCALLLYWKHTPKSDTYNKDTLANIPKIQCTKWRQSSEQFQADKEYEHAIGTTIINAPVNCNVWITSLFLALCLSPHSLSGSPSLSLSPPSISLPTLSHFQNLRNNMFFYTKYCTTCICTTLDYDLLKIKLEKHET